MKERELEQIEPSAERIRQMVAAVQLDREAFGDLYDVFIIKLCRYVNWKVSNREDAEEIADWTMFRAYEALDSYQDHGQFFAWLKSIANNRIIDHHRALNRKSQIPLTQIDPLDTAQGQGTATRAIEANIELRETHAALEDLCAKQNAATQQLLHARYHEGKKLSEIASESGSSAGAVKQRLRYQLQKLRKEVTHEQL